MWQIYDQLIQGIPEDWKAEEIIRGTYYTGVRCRGSVGLSSAIFHDSRKSSLRNNMIGRSLKDIAQSVKSWNYLEAAIGLAAMNAYYNHPQTLEQSGFAVDKSMQVEDRVYDPIIMCQHLIRGANVAMYGRFPHIETLIEPVCNLSVISSDEYPDDGDYPLAAFEFIFPNSDYVFIGSSSIDTKLLPRMLQVSQNARRVTIVGPATTLSLVLFDYGVHDLSGFVVKDADKAMRIVAGAETDKIFSSGQKVSLQKKQAGVV